MTGPDYHRPALVSAVLGYLVGDPAGLYLDGTVGGGGHAAAILTRCPQCRLLGFDRDSEALAAARTRLARFGDRVRLAQLSFRRVADDTEVRLERLAGALLDLGASSHQLDLDRRGFSIRRGVRLDMRMDQEGGRDATAFLASVPRRDLLNALRAGDAPRAGALAARIVRVRATRTLRTSDDLVAALESVLRRPASHAEKARLFQAVRIEVNGEIDALRRGLPAIRDVLRPGAVLAVISYHSVEDRIVKRAFREWSDPSRGLPPRLPLHELPGALGSVLTAKPVRPGAEEVAENPRARPARLRAWRRAA